MAPLGSTFTDSNDHDDVVTTISVLSLNVTLNATPEWDEGNRVISETGMWIGVFTVCSFLGVAIATCNFIWDRHQLPESHKKRKLRSLEERRKKEEKAIAAIKKEPIQVDQFLQKLRQKKLDKYLNYEVRAIVRNQEEFPCTVATHPDNVSQNINQDVIPYDHSRIIVSDLPVDAETDYINASYIEGYHGDREYITTQGPRGKAVATFWHMVWQEGVHCIVMATGLFEMAVQQCDKYWGDVFSVQKYVQQGEIHILLLEVLELSKLIIRTFHIRREGEDEVRLVKHFEMVGFSDENTDPGFILDVRRRVNTFVSSTTGPILVHCRCGGGKTAVFIAVDFCLKQLKMEDFVDIYSTVLHLRKFRKNMVRTLGQYKLIYDTLALHVQARTTVVPAAQLPALTQKLSLNVPGSQTQGFEDEFQFLQRIVPKIPNGDCASGHRDENRNKSRDIMLLPPERARPYLQTMETNDTGTDFINAVYVDGYHQHNRFLVSQWPMQSTINDIWRLLYDFKVNSLVVLNDTKCSRTVPCFWPKTLDREEKYGPIGVKYLGCQKYPHIIIRAFSIRKKAICLPLVGDPQDDCVVVKMFQYTSWHPRDKTPTSTKSFLYMMGCIDQWQEKNNKQSSSICVLSKDGYSKCGLYTTLSICCDQMHCEEEIDVFNAVRTIKNNRPQLVPTLAEYVYCYEYMNLLVHIMLEETPKIVVTSPSVIEGEIRQGYELVTGFENVLAPVTEHIADSSNKHSYHIAGSSATDHLLEKRDSEEEEDSRGSSSSAVTSSIEARNQHQIRKSLTLNLTSCAGDQGHSNNSRPVGRGYKKGPRKSLGENGHMRENGMIVDADRVNSKTDQRGVIAPATPGQIWSPTTTDRNHNERGGYFSGEQLLMGKKGPAHKKRFPLNRQNAQEVMERSARSSKAMPNNINTSVL